MDKKIIFVSVLSALVCASLAVNGFLVFALVRNSQDYQQHQVNQKVLGFRNMFTQKVLLSEREIDFDTRLSLETAVRALDDQQIFSQWQKFVNSQTKEEATTEAKELLELLIQKTSI